MSWARVTKRQLDGHSGVGKVNSNTLVEVCIWLAKLSILLSFGRTSKPFKLFSNNTVKYFQCKFSHVLQNYLLH